MQGQLSMFPLVDTPEVSSKPESPKARKKPSPSDSGNRNTGKPRTKSVSKEPESPEAAQRPDGGASSRNLVAGALRTFGILYRNSDHERVVIKVWLPADGLDLARQVPPAPRLPGEPGRPSVAQGLAAFLGDALNSLPEREILRAARTDIGEPAAGLVNVDVDAPTLAELSACAKGLRLTVPQLLARLLSYALRNGIPDSRPPMRLTPGLLEVGQALQRRIGIREQTVHVALPVADLTAAKAAASVAGVSRMDMLGRLITAGLDAADADPWPVLRSLTSPQTVVPPASSKSRVTIPVGVWASVQALAALASRPADDVAAALLGLGLSTRGRATGHA